MSSVISPGIPDQSGGASEPNVPSLVRRRILFGGAGDRDFGWAVGVYDVAAPADDRVFAGGKR
jgi:hypothetical protein